MWFKVLFFVSPIILYLPLSYLALINLGNLWKYRNEYEYKSNEELENMMRMNSIYSPGLDSNRCIGKMKEYRTTWYILTIITAILFHFYPKIGELFFIIGIVILIALSTIVLISLIFILITPRKSKIVFCDVYRPALYIHLCNFLYCAGMTYVFIFIKVLGW